MKRNLCESWIDLEREGGGEGKKGRGRQKERGRGNEREERGDKERKVGWANAVDKPNNTSRITNQSFNQKSEDSHRLPSGSQRWVS